MSEGAKRIAAERQRQIEFERWTPEHDDAHGGAELALAAACYALPSRFRRIQVWDRSLISELWPWTLMWWKPSSDRIRELEKAGALCAAEIDRLLRLGEQP